MIDGLKVGGLVVLVVWNMADVFQDDGFSEAEDVVLFESTENNSNGGMEQEDDDNIETEDSTDDVMASSAVELIHPITKLQNLIDSDLIYDRQFAARNILDVLGDVVSDEDDVKTVVSLMCRLSDDSESVVRVEVLDQVLHIATFCSEQKIDLKSVIRQQLIPLAVKHLSDPENRVLQASQSSLIGLLERGLIDKAQLCEWICPLAAQQAGSVVDCVKIDAVTLMCRMAPLIEKEIAVKFFLEQFASLCLDSSIGVRQVCAANFGWFCKVAGTEATENILLSQFLSLCGDDTWVIRKNCAEVFMDVSDMVSASTRREILPNIFLNFLCDNSRPVRASAYQSLGAVIATFADPKKTGVLQCEDGSFVAVPIEDTSGLESASNSQTDIFMMDEQSHKDNEMDISDSVVNEENCCTESASYNNDNIASIVENEMDSQVILKTVSRTEIVSDVGWVNCISGNFDEELNQEKLIPESENSGDGTNFSNQLKEDKNNEIDDHEMLCPDNYSDTAAGDQVSSHKMAEKTGDCGCIQLPSSSPQESCTDHHFQTRMDSETESSIVAAQKNGHLPHFLKNDFNNFQYWRVPLPDTELDVDTEHGRSSNIHPRANVHNEKVDQTSSSELSKDISTEMETPQTNPIEEDIAQHSGQCTEKLQVQTSTNIIMDGADVETSEPFNRTISVVNSSFNNAIDTVSKDVSEIKQTLNTTFCTANEENCIHPLCQETPSDSLISEHDKSPYEQDIVPPQLLERYINMVDPNISSKVDEITRKCAYNFPAVVYTLGRHNWPCIKSLCNTLAKDVQWKVRKTVAVCLHELGMILGSEIAARDLLPVFLLLVKDVDEVRTGVLMHIAEFLKLLNASERREFLPCIEEFVKMDNQNIWRYRHMLAQQMNPMTDLFSPSDIKEHFVPVAMWLIRDRVSEVRQAAIKLTAVILRRLAEDKETTLALWLLTELTDKFKQAQKWLWRQTYAFLCQQIAIENALPHEMFVSNVVPQLLTLSWDSVPNVRLAVSRCLAQTLLPSGYFPSIQKAHYQLLLQVMYSLQSDADSDVRYFARVTAEAFNVMPEKNVAASVTMEVVP